MVVDLVTPQELRKLRKKAGLTQKELAKRAGISQSLIARIEKGTVDPRLSTLRKIINIINEVLGERKFLARSIMSSPVISLDVNDTIGKAIELMWKYGISQLPVFQNGKLVGSIREDSILNKIKNEKIEDLLNKKVYELKEEPFPIVNVETSIEEIGRILLSGKPAVLVEDNGKIVGIITKIDLIAKQFIK
jgi:predicted transcriptional regulator